MYVCLCVCACEYGALHVLVTLAQVDSLLYRCVYVYTYLHIYIYIYVLSTGRCMF